VAGDSIWIYPAIVMALGFVAVAASLHQVASAAGKIPGLLALAFAVLAAGLLVGDYFVHLTVVEPSIAKGEGAAMATLSIYNPHGVFIALENAGYFVMGLAFLATSRAVARTGRLAQAIRWVFLVAGALAVGGLVLLGALFGTDLDVRYEVAAISIDYLALAVGGALLAVLLRRPIRVEGSAGSGSARRAP
jgi:hypothetical protein